jgi:hypothetical protein
MKIDKQKINRVAKEMFEILQDEILSINDFENMPSVQLDAINFKYNFKIYGTKDFIHPDKCYSKELYQVDDGVYYYCIV